MRSIKILLNFSISSGEAPRGGLNIGGGGMGLFDGWDHCRLEGDPHTDVELKSPTSDLPQRVLPETAVTSPKVPEARRSVQTTQSLQGQGLLPRPVVHRSKEQSESVPIRRDDHH